MKRILLALSIIIFAVALPASTFAASASTKPFYYAAWLPFWQSQAGAQDLAINLDKMNEVSPFSYELSSNGALIDDLNINNGSWAGWFSAATAERRTLQMRRTSTCHLKSEVPAERRSLT